MYGAPTIKALDKITKPLMRQIFQTAPQHLKPVWRRNDGKYWFKNHNDAEIHVAGCNNGHEDDLRGTAAGICLLDEAAMIDDLEYVIEDVLMPQLLTTGGNLIMASTPPRTPAHSFVTYMQKAEKQGDYAEYTIEQSGYHREVIERFIAEAGGRDSTTCQREYFCKCVVDKDYAIIPEWTDKFVQEYPRDKQVFQYFHRYDAMDIGGRDKTAVLFGYYDFPGAKLVVEDELIFEGHQTTTGIIAGAVRLKEQELWGYKGENEKDRPYLRIADNNNVIMLQDLGQMYGVHFLPTSKDNLQAMVNQVRMWVVAGRLLVNPRCKETIGCLKYGIWNDTRTEFARSKTYGHFDALAALVYLCRNVNVYDNPIPENWNKTDADHFILPQKNISRDGKEILKIFKLGAN